MPVIQVNILGIEPKELFMESVYLIVMGLLLGYLAERQKKIERGKRHCRQNAAAGADRYWPCRFASAHPE